MAQKVIPGTIPALPRSYTPAFFQTQLRHFSPIWRPCKPWIGPCAQNCAAQRGQHDRGKKGEGASSADAEGYDPSPAQGFASTGDDPELWWVVKYEERRKALAAQQQKEDGAHARSRPNQALIHLEGASSSEERPKKPNFVAAVVQGLQLNLVLAALFLWPASTQPAGLVCLRVWCLYLVYWLFFSQGTVQWKPQFGKQPRRSEDGGRLSWSDCLALISFTTSIVLLHWLPVLRYTKLGIYPTEVTGYEALGLPAIVAALLLNRRAVRDFGEASNLVTTPKQLVINGAYAHIQHPIYTSHMLLCFGTAMLLHSAPTALLFVLVCTTYYWRLIAQETRVLEKAFGEKYRAYAAKTPRFLPFPRF
ncbi:hypothetical protein DUNSADRAFT_12371 [Dunaliella salina]|uniref:Protein-S-isoprenylcysteine O-methyltransferase n=1 Tax=Dunaliella salina TaxID=3046 RepID=A0ABQ7GBG0_DUNSA|nr:hypothetical protein DUNSADRAFT_12371 [Dunaliella salina]|eukprot:KAF5831938.1 hypothetical protein DUNSADRAFT_12371 [Dunaliella salina]